MEQALAELRGAASGRLQFAVPPTGRLFACRLLGAFVQGNPGIQASLQIHDRLTLLERLARNADDLYMLLEPPEAGEVVVQAIVPNPLVVLASSEHTLAGQAEIPFARLAKEPLLMREPGAGTRMITLRLFARHGLAPKIHMELGSDEAIREARACRPWRGDPAALRRGTRSDADEANLPGRRRVSPREPLESRLSGGQAPFNRRARIHGLRAGRSEGAVSRGLAWRARQFVRL